MKTKRIVTKDTMREMLSHPNRRYVETVVGRALVAVFKNQTADERKSKDTITHNGVGFAPMDAKSGSLTAMYFMKHGRLEDWQLDNWLRHDSTGYPRIAKYHKQLDMAARAKAAPRAPQQLDMPDKQSKPMVPSLVSKQFGQRHIVDMQDRLH